MPEPEFTPQPSHVTYKSDCGCRVVFFSPFYRSLRFEPGEECRQHTRQDQMPARNDLIEFARRKLDEKLGRRPPDILKFSQN